MRESKNGSTAACLTASSGCASSRAWKHYHFIPKCRPAALAQAPREQQQILLRVASHPARLLESCTRKYTCMFAECLPTACLSMSGTGRSRAGPLPPTMKASTDSSMGSLLHEVHSLAF